MTPKTLLPTVLAALFLLPVCALRAQNEPAANPPALAADPATNGNADSFRSLLQLQEQLHATQLAIERNRREAADAAARATENMAARLQTLEQSIAAQREKDLNRLEQATRFMVMVGGGCAAVGFLAMLLTAYLQWRAVNRLTEFSMVTSASLRALPPMGAETTSALAAQAGSQLHSALDQIGRRIHQLEHPKPTPAETTSVSTSETISASTSAATVAQTERVAALTARGQAHLDVDEAEPALAAFNEALAIDSRHAEALVKKGEALERLRRSEEAIACYDAAITADGSLTIAYLHKGGLLNRMDRYEEALKCYELALQTQERAKDEARFN